MTARDQATRRREKEMPKSVLLKTVLDPRGQPSGVFGRTVIPNSVMMDILDPRSQPEITLEPARMSPRLKTLEKKTVYLVNTGFAGAKEFMEETHAWFSRERPSVKTVLVHKKTSMFTDDPELWAEIQANGDAVIFGVGG